MKVSNQALWSDTAAIRSILGTSYKISDFNESRCTNTERGNRNYLCTYEIWKWLPILKSLFTTIK